MVIVESGEKADEISQAIQISTFEPNITTFNSDQLLEAAKKFQLVIEIYVSPNLSNLKTHKTVVERRIFATSRVLCQMEMAIIRPN